MLQSDFLAFAGELFMMPTAQIREKCRLRRYVRARHAVAYALRHRRLAGCIPMSYPRIAQYLSWRDHTTAINAVRCAAETMERDALYACKVRALIAYTPPQVIL